MRIHTDYFRASAVQVALLTENAAGRIANHVTFKTLREHRSSVREHGIEIQLEAAHRDNGRRAGNSGSYGAMCPERDGYAATYDEWGWLLSALYELDRDMIVGPSMKNAIYDSALTFDHRTGLTYQPKRLLPLLVANNDPYPWVTGNAARTKRGYFIGRYGAGRIGFNAGIEYESRGWPVAFKPRDPAEYAAFAHVELPAEVTA